MIKILNIKTGLLILLVAVVSSCTEIIDMKFTTDFERLVVDAQILDRDTVQYVKLYKINLDNEESIVSPIADASVVVNDGANDIIFNESTVIGLYVAPKDFVGEYGKTYSLTMKNTRVLGVDKSDTYIASAIMGDSLVFDSTTYDYIYLPHMRLAGFNLKCWAWDPPERNYYLFKAWKNGVILTDTLYEYAQSDDAIFNGTYIAGADCQFLSDYKADEYVVVGDTITLEIDNIDKDYFDYLNSAQSDIRISNPMFGGPPANVVTNISNGAVGIFRVFSVSKSSVIVKEGIR